MIRTLPGMSGRKLTRLLAKCCKTLVLAGPAARYAARFRNEVIANGVVADPEPTFRDCLDTRPRAWFFSGPARLCS